MNSKQKHNTRLTCMMLCAGLTCSVQTYGWSNDSPWLSCQNAAALSTLPDIQTSDAHITYGYEDGRYRNFFDPVSRQSISAVVRSLYRITPRLAASGFIEYTSKSDSEMAGSAFIYNEDANRPFDIVEDSLTNEGDAHLDRYHLAGALSYQLNDRISIGAKIDYTAANYAKFKDLRHSNSLMDFIITSGVFLKPLKVLALGADFYYRRNTESVTFRTFGSTDKTYVSFVDYGAFMGETETFGENGYTSKNTELPFVSEHLGFATQVSADITPSIAWFSEFSYRHRQGYYGKMSEYSIAYNEHRSHIYQLSTELSYKKVSTCHRLHGSLNIENLQNDANTYRSTVDKHTSAYRYEYYSKVRMADKLWYSWQVGYQGDYCLQNEVPSWSFGIAYTNRHRKITSYIYPYMRRQELDASSIDATLTRNIPLHKGLLSLTAGFYYSKGSGEAAEDNVLATPSDKQTAPASMNDYLMQEYACYTSPNYTARLKVRYTLPTLTQGLTPYAETGGQYAHLNTHNISRTVFEVTLGTKF